MAFASLRVVIVKHIEVAVPRSTDKIVLFTPVDETRDVAILLLDISLLGSVFLVVVRLFKALLGHSIFDVDAVGTASLIADEKFSLALIKADASDVCVTDVTEHILQATIGRIPDLDAGRMRRDKSVEHRVVKDAKASILISQVVINRLVIVIEDK